MKHASGADVRRIVVKLGTGLLTYGDGQLDASELERAEVPEAHSCAGSVSPLGAGSSRRFHKK